jgi:hypothetical protein
MKSKSVMALARPDDVATSLCHVTHNAMFQPSQKMLSRDVIDIYIGHYRNRRLLLFTVGCLAVRALLGFIVTCPASTLESS